MVAIASMAVMVLSGGAPALAAGLDFCSTVAEPVDAHACCAGEAGSAHSHHGIMDAPAMGHGHHANAHAGTDAHEATMSHVAESGSGSADACSCAPASNLPSSEEVVATAIDVPSPRQPVFQVVATLSDEFVISPATVALGQRSERARTLESSPPLYLLHDLLLI